MSNHQKRLSVPKSWPVERKTDTFTVKADGPHGKDGVPLLILLRDVLGYVDSKKEARYALEHGSVLVNGDENASEHRPIGMFDILAFAERDEYYRVFPDEGGRLALTPIDGDAADSKLSKIENKTLVTGGRTQLNLHDGSNILVEDGDEYGSGDSIVVGNEDNEIVAHFPYEEGSLVTAVRGQHAGEVGEIAEIKVTPGSGSNSVTVESEEGSFETVEEYVVVIDENFTGDAETASENPSGDNREDGDADEESAESDDESGGDDE